MNSISEIIAMIEHARTNPPLFFVCPNCDCTWPIDLFPDKKCPACPKNEGWRDRCYSALVLVAGSPPPQTKPFQP